MSRQPQVQFNLSISPTVKILIYLNVGIWFLLQVLGERFLGLEVTKYLSLVPAKVIYDFHLWQPLTYMFLHTLQVTHILFNMLMLWFIGTELENHWGRKFFINFYLACGLGAALIYCFCVGVYFYIKPSTTAMIVPVVGASGAIYGLLLAYGLLFGERTIHMMGLFPIKARTFVLILGSVEFVSLLTSNVNGGDVAYLAHLGGIVSGFLILKFNSFFQKMAWNRRLKKRTRNLKLVVDNEQSENKKDPKYWN